MKIIIDEVSNRSWLLELKELFKNECKYQISDLIKAASSIANKYIGSDISLIANELSHGDGYVLFKGVPIDYGRINIFSGMNSDFGNPSVSELSLLGVTAASGFNPFSFLQEKQGKIVHEVIPQEGCGDVVSSCGSVEFKLHADGAYLNRSLRPEVLSLMCLNNDSKTKTNLMLIDDVVNRMEVSDVDILSSLNYIHVSPETFNVGGGSRRIKSSILDKVDGRWEVKVATHNTEPCTEEARLALGNFIRLANYSAVSVFWEPGDLVVFNNFRCLHGRGDIMGRRWLKRCYGSKNLSLARVIDLNERAA